MKPTKVLIADDDQGILDSLGMLLEFEGYDVATTLNGDSLLELGEELPDLILLDIWMSGVDGRDICRHLKQSKKTAGLPVVLISASHDIERSALEAGADDFVAKPFDMDTLLKKIERLIN